MTVMGGWNEIYTLKLAVDCDTLDKQFKSMEEQYADGIFDTQYWGRWI